MLKYEMIYDVCSEEFCTTIGEADSYCLLLPDLICNVFNKISNKPIQLSDTFFSDNGKFINGYAILCSGEYIERIYREDGTMIEVPPRVMYKAKSFSDDRLLVIVGDKMAFIDGIDGQLHIVPQEYNGFWVSEYSCGYARVKSDTNSNFFIDKDFKKITDTVFEEASMFLDGKALVCTEDKWQIIDTNFNVLLEFERNEERHALFLGIAQKMDEQVSNSVRESLAEKIRGRWHGDIILRDKKTKISIFAPHIVKDIADRLEVTIPEGLDLKEALVWLVDYASSVGNFVYDLKKGELSEVELRTGMQISSDCGKVVTYDADDIKFLRQRIREDSINE